MDQNSTQKEKEFFEHFLKKLGEVIFLKRVWRHLNVYSLEKR